MQRIKTSEKKRETQSTLRVSGAESSDQNNRKDHDNPKQLKKYEYTGTGTNGGNWESRRDGPLDCGFSNHIKQDVSGMEKMDGVRDFSPRKHTSFSKT